MPRTSSGGIRSVYHMRRQMRNSSFVASTDTQYASTGTLSHPGALPNRRASRHLCSSSSPSSSSSAVKHSSDLFLSASGLANFAPRNLDHSSRSWSCVTSRSPLRSLDGLILRGAETSQNSVKTNGGWLNAQSACHVVKITESTSMRYSMIWTLLNVVATAGKCPG